MKLPAESKNPPNPAEVNLNSLAGEFKNAAQIVDDRLHGVLYHVYRELGMNFFINKCMYVFINK